MWRLCWSSAQHAFYFCLGFWHYLLQCTPFKAMKSMSYFYECTRGIEDLGCEIVMAVGVGWGTSVL